MLRLALREPSCFFETFPLSFWIGSSAILARHIGAGTREVISRATRIWNRILSVGSNSRLVHRPPTPRRGGSPDRPSCQCTTPTAAVRVKLQSRLEAMTAPPSAKCTQRTGVAMTPCRTGPRRARPTGGQEGSCGGVSSSMRDRARQKPPCAPQEVRAMAQATPHSGSVASSWAAPNRVRSRPARREVRVAPGSGRNWRRLWHFGESSG